MHSRRMRTDRLSSGREEGGGGTSTGGGGTSIGGGPSTGGGVHPLDVGSIQKGCIWGGGGAHMRSVIIDI